MEVFDYSCRNSGQIPAFGDWDKAKDLPITQYFESARQAGLIRYSSSSGESGPAAELYTVHRKKPAAALPRKVKVKGRVREKRHPQVGLKDEDLTPIKKKQGKVFDMTEQGGARKVKQNDVSVQLRSNANANASTARPPKPVDEDLYKIPPELLHSSKRNKMKGLFSRCLVPACN